MHTLAAPPHDCVGENCHLHGKLMEGAIPIVVIEHIEAVVVEEKESDFWDPKGTFWDNRKELLSNPSFDEEGAWTPADDGLRNSGTVGTFARYATHKTKEKKGALQGGRRRGGGFDSREQHISADITDEERKKLEELYVTWLKVCFVMPYAALQCPAGMRLTLWRAERSGWIGSASLTNPR